MRWMQRRNQRSGSYIETEEGWREGTDLYANEIYCKLQLTSGGDGGWMDHHGGGGAAVGSVKSASSSDRRQPEDRLHLIHSLSSILSPVIALFCYFMSCSSWQLMHIGRWRRRTEPGKQIVAT